MKASKRYPHLHGALSMTGAPGTGMCIHRAAGLVLDMPGSELVFGTLDPPPVEGGEMVVEPFIHAWVEVGDQVYAPTTMEANGNILRPYERDFYYRINGVSNVKRLTRRQLLGISGQIGLSAHLRHHKPAKASVGGTLLEAAGVAWTESEVGGLVPA